jgi:hypothetical protein
MNETDTRSRLGSNSTLTLQQTFKTLDDEKTTLVIRI